MQETIKKYLMEFPHGLKAAQLAALIGVEKKKINSYLYSSKGQQLFEVDSNYVWRIKKNGVPKEAPISSACEVVPIRKSNNIQSKYRYLPQNKTLLNRSVFWVYQNKTYHEERRGGFLWSPKYTIDGRRHPGYEAMKEVKPGDIILHGFQTNVVAISLAKSSCYSFDRPSVSFSDWAKDGWKIDCEYFVFSHELSTENICFDLFKFQPDNGPLIAPRIGRQQYLCNANKRMLDCILNECLRTYQKDQTDTLLQFLELDTITVTVADDKKNDQELLEDILIEKFDKNTVENGCKVGAIILSTQKKTIFTIDTSKFPSQKPLIGKRIGDRFTINGVDLEYQITKIWFEIER